MKNIFKVFIWGVGALVALALIAIAAFAFLFDPNALRDDITRLVESKTGRQLTIEGDLSLSFFPWLGFDAGRTTLSNAEGFSEPPVMVSFDSASASVKLMPLLGRRIELSQVTLDGVDLQLEVKADGTTNWSDLEALAGEDTAETSDGAGFAAEQVGGIRLTNTRISYNDAQSGSIYAVSNLDLRTGALAPGAAFDLEASGDIVSEADGIAGPARIEGEVEIDESGVIRISKLQMDLTARGEGVPGDEMIVDLQTPMLELDETTLTVEAPVLTLNGTGSGDPYSTLNATLEGESLSLVDSDRLDLPAPKLTAGISAPELPGGEVDVSMTGERMQGSLDNQNIAIDVVRGNLLDLSLFSKKVKASSIIDAPVVEAPIEIAEFSPQKLFRKLGYDDIVTADPQALSKATLSSNATYGPESMGLKNMKATVDDTAVTGSVRVMSSGQVRFDITADNVNLDRYRSPATTPEEAGQAATVADVEIPAEELRLLELDGKLKVGQMQLVGLKSSDVEIAIRASGGDVRVKPARAQLYGGSYNGDIRLDASGERPVLSLNERLDNVQFGPFSADLLNSERLSGTVSGRMTVTGTGFTSNEITASSNGDLVFGFSDGAYEGMNLPYQVRRARALVKGEAPPPAPTENRTEFGNLGGTAKIVNGVLSSQDLNAVMPFMKISGSGNMALVSQEIDFSFTGEVYDRPELDVGDEDLVGFPVPIRISGTAAAPKVGVDMGGLLAELAKRKLMDKIGLGGGSDGDPNAEPAKTPEDLIEQKEEEIRDKVKDKLKDLFGGGDDDG